ncbi:MAG TPA: ribosomal RNA small subunit methyltransferase A [Candidatus Parcubacteria bacterium]|nr:ribosomal RNA small subunit methyltransferase A [Candidatus Parcubacteria bacterium]
MSQSIIKINKEHKFRPSKRLGQNFLTDKKAIKKIIDSAGIKRSETVIEIGTGFGNLTQEIAKKAKRVIAIEKDRRICEVVEKSLKNLKNVKVVKGDFLKIPFNKYQISGDYKIIANPPFYIVSPLIRKSLEFNPRPKEIVLVVQKEIGQRACPQARKDGKTPLGSVLAATIRLYAKEAKLIGYISKKSFWPKPDVDSSIIKIIPRRSKISDSFKKDFLEIVKAGFSQPRKQIANNLAKKLKKRKEEVEKWLLDNGIQPNQRAESLTIDDWSRLAKNKIKENY